MPAGGVDAAARRGRIEQPASMLVKQNQKRETSNGPWRGATVKLLRLKTCSSSREHPNNQWRENVAARFGPSIFDQSKAKLTSNKGEAHNRARA